MLLMSWFLGHRAYGILAPRPGIKSAPSALEGEMLTTGPAGKSPFNFTDGFKMKNKRMYARASLVKDPPANAADTASIPDRGRSHMRRAAKLMSQNPVL